MLAVHRGIVPVKNLPNRDFAIAGALVSCSDCKEYLSAQMKVYRMAVIFAT